MASHNTALAKVFCDQIHKAIRKQDSTLSLHNHSFSRVWLQGVVVDRSNVGETCEIILDDGHDTMVVDIEPNVVSNIPGKGAYVMIIGIATDDEVKGVMRRRLLCHQLMDLSTEPDRESLWHTEVVHYWMYMCGTLATN